MLVLGTAVVLRVYERGGRLSNFYRFHKILCVKYPFNA